NARERAVQGRQHPRCTTPRDRGIQMRPRWCDAGRVAVSSNVLFRDRHEAGRALAGLLEHYRGRDDVMVLALPRGGVPVAYEVATALGSPLDVFLVRKLGVPGHEELAMGAIASGGVVVLNDAVVRDTGITTAARR